MAKKSSSKAKSKKTTKKTSGASRASSSRTSRAATRAAAKPSKKAARKPAGKSDADGKSSGNGSAAGKSTPRQKIKSPLTKAQLKEFRDILLEKRRELIGDMYGIEADALGKYRQDDRSEAYNMPTHPADVGTDNFEQEFTLGLLESERILLGEINEALERIEANTYGVCLGTGKAISLARLKARPWSKYCIDYQRMLEQGLVRPEDDDYGFGADEADEDVDVDVDDEDDDEDEDGDEASDSAESEEPVDEDDDF